MTPVPLSKILGRKSHLRQSLGRVLEVNEGISILDMEEKLLIGSQSLKDMQRFPVVAEGQTIGWVLGKEGTDQSAALLVSILLGKIAGQEGEKKSLAGELLERYRELHLLYNLSEHLAVSPLPADIASVALQEVMRLVPADSGLILLIRDGAADGGAPTGESEGSGLPGEAAYAVIAARGTSHTLISNCCVIERVLETARAEVANAVPAVDYFEGMGEGLLSVACAPLKTKERTLGAVILIGDNDRTFTAGELMLLNTIAQQAAPAIEISRLYEVSLENARIEHELKMARQVQVSLLPATLPKAGGWSFDTRWKPAWEVSGDFYDIIEERGGKLGVVIGDITGKGMSASLFMVFARSAVRASTGKGLSPGKVLQHSNRLICQDSHEGLFATLLYAQLNTQTGELSYSNAGHLLPILVRRDTHEIISLHARGLPLGAMISARFEERTQVIHPGDCVLFYTDGVTETFNSAGEEFGEDRLRQVLEETRGHRPGEILDAVERAVSQFARGGKPSDDLTLLILQRS
jgi:serine phosphatase RsbU (regulator of sigma subunit)